MSAPRSLLAQVSVADLEPVERILDPEYPPEWREIATVLFLQLRTRPATAATGDTALAVMALELAEGLRAEIGGSQPYLSKGTRYTQSLRDRQIFEESTGRNLGDLARKYDLTERQVYNILGTQLRIERARRQGTLPLDD